jgi:hypothetical protein
VVLAFPGTFDLVDRLAEEQRVESVDYIVQELPCNVGEGVVGQVIQEIR